MRDEARPRHANLRLSDVVEELAQDIARADVDRCILVGHSQAGTVLPRLAAACAVQVDRLIYVSCCAPREGETIAAMLARTAPPAMRGEGTWEQRFAAMFCNDMSAQMQSAFMAKLGRDEWPSGCAVDESNWGYDAASHIDAAYVLLLRDQILTPEAQLEFAQRLHARRIIRIDAGHQVQQTRPHALAEIIRQEIGKGG